MRETCLCHGLDLECKCAAVKSSDKRRFNAGGFAEAGRLGLQPPPTGPAHNACAKRFERHYKAALEQAINAQQAAPPPAHATRSAAQAAQPFQPRAVQPRAHAPEPARLQEAAGALAGATAAGRRRRRALAGGCLAGERAPTSRGSSRGAAKPEPGTPGSGAEAAGGAGEDKENEPGESLRLTDYSHIHSVLGKTVDGPALQVRAGRGCGAAGGRRAGGAAQAGPACMGRVKEG